MNKASLLILGAMALLSLPASAQTDPSIALRMPTDKGNWMLGSSIVVGELAFGSLSSDYNVGGVYNVSLAPKAGYFIKDNLMLGGSINVNFSGNAFGSRYYASGYHSQSVGLGVFARQYFGKALDREQHMRRMRFFVEAGAGFNKGWSRYGTSDTTTEHGQFGSATFHVMPGLNYFFNQNIALEAGLNVSHTAASDHHVIGNANRIGLNVGLQIFVGRR